MSATARLVSAARPPLAGVTGYAATVLFVTVAATLLFVTAYAATSVLRGRPRGRLRGTIAPRISSSPPQTPQGSLRSSAPVRQASLALHPRHIALAVSTSFGRFGEEQLRVLRARKIQAHRERGRRTGHRKLTRHADLAGGHPVYLPDLSLADEADLVEYLPDVWLLPRRH